LMQVDCRSFNALVYDTGLDIVWPSERPLKNRLAKQQPTTKLTDEGTEYAVLVMVLVAS
jgi:hypothetical protein